MPSGRDPTDRVIDLVIAVPVSIVAAARQLIPVGVTRLEQKVARDLDLLVRYARRAVPAMPRRSRAAARSRASVDDATARAVRAAEESVDVAADAAAEEAVDAAAEIAHEIDTVASSAVEVVADHLPIEGYDQLSARQIVDRLGALTRAELALIAQHEHEHRRRQTILLRIAQLT